MSDRDTDGAQDDSAVLQCPNCERQVELKKPLIGGTFVVRCQSGENRESCHHEMVPVGGDE